MFKKHKLVRLPIKKKATGIWQNLNGSLTYSQHLTISNAYNKIPQHIYMLSNEKIEEGDWVYDETCNRVSNKPIKDVFEYKIIASTNPELNLPTFSESFIKKYCELGGVDEVMVEYEESLYDKAEYHTECAYYGYSDIEIGIELRTRTDNTIITKKVKDSYTAEEVISVVEKAWIESEKLALNRTGCITIDAFIDKYL